MNKKYDPKKDLSMKVYLCCPYSHKDKKIMDLRFEMANKVAGVLMQDGHIVFSPLSHSVPIADTMDNHLSYDFWLKQDFAFVDWADEIHVLTLPGWEDSIGIAAEIKRAQGLGKPVRYI